MAGTNDQDAHPTLKSEKAALTNLARMKQEVVRVKKADEDAKEPNR